MGIALTSDKHYRHNEVISGEVHLKLQDVETKASDSATLVAGGLVLIDVGVAHALELVKSGQAIECSVCDSIPPMHFGGQESTAEDKCVKRDV
ncbi:MAG TPA: hypothetical protein VLT36_08165 [Candidatus Dormibacteraeota bacterium]|nr:hypothetical protein [Candidatus Dormibacteraeota bacterium]